MKNLLVQARTVSSPIKNPLIGWWCEYYFFYVKHRDLDARELLSSMMLDPEADMSSLNTAAAVPYYHYGSTIPWTALCLKRVVEEYFRDEGEAWDTWLIDTLPVASVGVENSWMDSVINAGDMPDDIVPADEPLTDLDEKWRMWEYLRQNALTNMSYEDWLGTYGIRQSTVEIHKPELVRYLREWTYPTNTIDPATGAPSSAVSWSVQDRADKDRFFKEPGFLIGCQVVRPKAYMSKQTGSAAGLMNDAFSWLPAMLREDVYTSLKQVAKGAGPLPGLTDAAGYWVDVRDLLIYGDQFINFALTETNAGLVALPTAALQKRYADSTMADALFSAASPANQIRTDGVVSLTILGTQVDNT